MSESDVQTEVVLKISADQASATLLIPATFSPEQLTVDLLRSVVEERNVQVNDQIEQSLEDIVTAFVEDPQRVEQVVAQLVQPAHGVDQHLEWATDCEPVIPYRPSREEIIAKTDQSPSIEYRAVEAGTCVARLHAPTIGTPGRDLAGQDIPAKPGSDNCISISDNLLIDDDGDISASIDGLLTFKKNTIDITTIQLLQGSVDALTGNIDAEGSVVVNEGVRQGFVLQAKGDVIVNGLIEAATIRCHGHLDAARGIAGHGRATLRIGGDARITFLDRVDGAIGGSLTVVREVIGSNLTIEKTLDAATASIVGGSLTIGGDATIASIGAESGTTTTLFVGLSPAEAEEIDRIESTADKLNSIVDRAKTELERLAEIPKSQLPSTDRERITELSFLIAEYEQQIDIVTDAVKQRRKQAEAAATVHIRIIEQIYPGVQVCVGGEKFEFPKLVEGPVTLESNGIDELYMRVGNGARRALSDLGWRRAA